MKLKLIALFMALCACVSSASATSTSYTGQFLHDNDVLLINFNVGAQSTVGLRTWSWAGGVNAAGQTIAGGGFDPIMELWDSTGKRIGVQDDAPCYPCLDINFSIQLAPGDYTVSIQQWDNFSLSDQDSVNYRLTDGFYYQGAQYENFRNGFVDVYGIKRNGSWALDILNVNPAAHAVPEPASLGLMGAALLGVTALRRRRKSA